MLADADRPRARDPRRDPVPAQRGGPAHRPRDCCRAAAARGRAGTTTCSTQPAGRPTVTYHMNRLQSLSADREFCVTLNRTEAIDPAQDPAHDPVRAPGLHRRRRRARRRATTRSAARNRTHFCGAYWGWGFHEDGVVSALARRRAARRRAAVTAQRALRGHDPPPPLRGPRARAPPPHRAGLPRPRRAAAAARRPARRAPARPRPLPPRRLPRRSRVAARRRGARARRGDRRAPTARSGCSRSLRTLGHCFNPVSFYYCFDGAEHLRGGRRRGDEHAVGRAPRLRPRAATAGAHGELDKALHVSPFMGMDQRYTVARRAARATTLSVHIESREDGERAFDATLTLAPAGRSRARRSARPRATLAADLRPRARAARSRASPTPHPERRDDARSLLALLAPHPRRAA